VYVTNAGRWLTELQLLLICIIFHMTEHFYRQGSMFHLNILSLKQRENKKFMDKLRGE
jgi:hypothetical protein